MGLSCERGPRVGLGLSLRDRKGDSAGCSAVDAHASTNLDGGEVFIELRVQRRKLVHRAVEDAVVVSKHLAQEEGGKGHIYYDPLEETGGKAQLSAQGT